MSKKSIKEGRNAICYCGSLRKYKKCHLMIDEGYVKDPDSGFIQIASYTTPAEITIDSQS